MLLRRMILGWIGIQVGISALCGEVITLNFEDARTWINDESHWNSTEYGDYYKGPGRECAFDATHYTDVNLIPVGHGVTVENVEAFGGGYWAGFAISNISALDSVSPGGGSNQWLSGGNQFASASLNGANDSEYYAIIYDGDACGFGPPPRLSFHDTVSLQSLAVQNTPWVTYGALNGDSFAGAAAQGDWFRCTIVGYDAEKAIQGIYEIMLFDYRGDSLQMISDWTELDFTTAGKESIFTDDDGDYLLAYGNTSDEMETFIEQILVEDVENSFENIHTLEFRLSGTQGSMWGLNTAAYCALDDITFVTRDAPGSQVPEPGTSLLLLLGLAGIFVMRRRKHS